MIKTPLPATPLSFEKLSTGIFASRAIGGYPFVGTPDRVADELISLSRSNIRGIAFSMVNYLEELPLFRDEVLPRVEKAGVREKR